MDFSRAKLSQKYDQKFKNRTEKELEQRSWEYSTFPQPYFFH